MSDPIYSFVYRGVLTDVALDRNGRQRRRYLQQEETQRMTRALSYDLIDETFLTNAQRMAVVYTALHAFEASVRAFVKRAMIDAHRESWWDQVPEKIQKKVQARMAEAAKFKWHGARGESELDYADFGDLSAIIGGNWQAFQDILVDLEWSRQILATLERSRNIVMHAGTLDQRDIERIGVNIRDWVVQVG